MKSWNLRAIPKLIRTVKHINPDIVHLHYQSGAYALNPAINLLPLFIRLSGLRAKVVTTLHDLRTPYVFPKMGRLRRLLVDRIARDSHGVIIVSPEDGIRLWGIQLYLDEVKCQRSTHISLVPVGPTIVPEKDTRYRKNWRAELGLSASAFVVGYLGFRQENKGMAVLSAALKNTDCSVREGVLALIGAGEPADASRNYDRCQSVDDIGQWKVVASGPLERAEMSRWLYCCDICVLPYSEGLSLRRSTFISAISHGIPVITTRPDMPLPGVVDEETAILVPPGDSGALSLAIAQLEESGQMQRDYGNRALTFSKQFSWIQNAQRTLALYHAVTNVC
jgi:glycosyltransferase involved in cell wall biosynthesis